MGEANSQCARIKDAGHDGPGRDQDGYGRRKPIVPCYDQKVRKGLVIVQDMLILNEQHVISSLCRYLDNGRTQRFKHVEPKHRFPIFEEVFGWISN